MNRIVLDTNVVVSALLKPGSIPEFVVGLAIGHPKVQWCISKSIVEEYSTVLSYGKFKKYIKQKDKDQALHLIVQSTLMIDSRAANIPRLEDPDDEKFLACAVASRASYLITGNIKHFPQSSYKRTQIVTPRQFYDAMIEGLAA